MAKRALITADRLREILHYDPETGMFQWIIPPEVKIRKRGRSWPSTTTEARQAERARAAARAGRAYKPSSRAPKKWEPTVGWTDTANRYRIICFKGFHYRAARLAWLYMTGEWPGAEIDHINLNRADDRWANLREATHPQNGANSHARGRSGIKGAYQHTDGGVWQAKITDGGKSIFLGSFVTAVEAHAAYLCAAKRRFGHFARGDDRLEKNRLFKVALKSLLRTGGTHV